MPIVSHILADDTDMAVKALIFVVALIIWGVSSLAKLAKNSTQKEKQRLAQVRQHIASQASRLQTMQPSAPPIALAPEIARRVPPVSATRAPAKRSPQRNAAKPAAITQQLPRRAAAPPPPLPKTQKTQPPTPTLESDATPRTAPARKSGTVNAVAINRWLRPMTLKQQFILTEVFHPPLSLRDRASIFGQD